MRKLRVLLTAAPDQLRADPWALYDAAGRLVERGRGVPRDWPSAQSCEAVLAADVVRVASIQLPPLPRSRLAQAARYAVEDRLATPVEHAVVAVGPRASDGWVIAAVVARELAESLSRVGRFDRAIAEPQLTEPTLSWRWCESATSAFVRTPDGGAFTVSPAAGPTLPPELLLALSQAARAGNAPPEVIADRTVDPAWVAGWERASGVPFVAGTRWQWDTQAPGRYASAIDLLDTLRAELAPPASSRRYRVATALGLGAAALVIHVLATFGTWVWGRLDLASADRRLNAIAREAAATDAASLARAHADARHRAGLDASQDAMPLLARAAPALAALPAGSMKAATYAAGAWTLELAPLDEATLAGLDQRLAAAGLSWLHAKSATGVRARITAEP